MTSNKKQLLYEELVIKDKFSEHKSKIFNNRTLNFVRKGTNPTFGEFELMGLKSNPEVNNPDLLFVL